jgi:hypothetical protein
LLDSSRGTPFSKARKYRFVRRNLSLWQRFLSLWQFAIRFLSLLPPFGADRLPCRLFTYKKFVALAFLKAVAGLERKDFCRFGLPQGLMAVFEQKIFVALALKKRFSLVRFLSLWQRFLSLWLF